MGLLRQLAMRAAKQLASDPETREKASRVLEDDVKPRAKEAWKQAQPEIANAKQGIKNYAKMLRDEYRKGREGE
jgi:hypothetical protein